MNRFAASVLATLALVSAQPSRAASDWPQFRGPDGQGVAEAKGLPASWSEKENVTWKTAIHGKAWSSPVVWGDQIWLTSATPEGHELFVVCVDKATGKIVHDVKLFDIATPQYCIDFNSYASPTPAIEEGRVYVTCGAAGHRLRRHQDGQGDLGACRTCSATTSAAPARRRSCGTTC